MTLGQLAQLVGADLVEPALPDGVLQHDGSPDPPAATREIQGVAGIAAAGPAQVTFVANAKYAAAARRTGAAAVIVEHAFPPLPVPTLRVTDPKYAFHLAVSAFHPEPVYPPGVHPTAVIAPSAVLGPGAHVGPYVVIGEGCRLGHSAVLLAHVVLYPGVRTGDRFTAHAHAVVRENCQLGNDVTLQNGAVIGADGFGFARDPVGDWVRTPHPGPVVLEDSVEVQTNSCVDRAIVGETRLGRNVKVDNLVQIGHASVIGAHSLLCAQVGLAGSTTVGRHVTLAGQVGVAGHLTIGDGVVATAQTGIPSNVPANSVVSGYPAMENRAWLRMVATLPRVPELLRRLRRAEEAQ